MQGGCSTHPIQAHAWENTKCKKMACFILTGWSLRYSSKQRKCSPLARDTLLNNLLPNKNKQDRRRAYTDILKHYFEEKWISTQKLFEHEERFHKILQLIPDESVVSELAGKWQGRRLEHVSSVRWDQLKHMLQSGIKKVTKGMNHLLKAPFCVHPGTGRVCVPIDPNTCEQFDPTSIPTLAQLLEELNANASIGTDNCMLLKFHLQSNC